MVKLDIQSGMAPTDLDIQPGAIPIMPLQPSKKSLSFGERLKNVPLNMANAFQDPNNPIAGAIKGADTSLYNIGSGILKSIEAVKNVLPGQPKTSTFLGRQQKPEVTQALKTTGLGQDIGYYGEKVGEFFIPEKAVSEVGGAIDTAVQGLNLAKYGKAAPLIAKALPIALKSAIEMVRTGGVTAIQTLSPEATKTAGIIGAASVPIAEGISYLLGKAAPSLAKSIQKSTLKITPTQQREVEAKINDTVDYLNENSITGTSYTRYNKINQIYNDTEKTYQDFLSQNAKDVFVDKSNLIRKLEKAKKIAMTDEADAVHIGKQFDNAISNIKYQYGANIENSVKEFIDNASAQLDYVGSSKEASILKNMDIKNISSIEELQRKVNSELGADSLSNPSVSSTVDNWLSTSKMTLEGLGNKIPVGRLNTLKRSTYSNAYNRAGDKVLDWVEHSIANIYKNSLEEATQGMTIAGKSMEEFNKEYGTVIFTKALLKASRTKGASFSSKILSAAIGGILGEPFGILGEAAGVGLAPIIAGGATGTLPRSIAGPLIRKAGDIKPSTLIKASKTIFPFINQ